MDLVADRGGAAAGTLSVTAPDDGEVEIISMWVAPAARGAGRVALDVAAENAPAVARYG